MVQAHVLAKEFGDGDQSAGSDSDQDERESKYVCWKALLVSTREWNDATNVSFNDEYFVLQSQREEEDGTNRVRQRSAQKRQQEVV
jgi:hypothetical protein